MDISLSLNSPYQTLKPKFICIILFSLLFFSYKCFSQNKFTISGNIKDTENKPLEYASVVLFKSDDSLQVAGTITNEKGFYTFENIKKGSYYFQALQIGYKKTKSDIFELNEDKTLNMSVLANSKRIDEVEILAQKAFIEQQADKTVVNVENSIVSTGVSVSEVLKRAPGVTVDKNGGVKLKGKDGVMVMIDDKPLYMDEAQLGALLKSIPADQVKNIEIMTNPSAKYDAEGNAGIINIKLKKGAYEGLNGSTTASYSQGVYPKANIGINLNYRKSKLSTSFGYQYGYKKNLERMEVNRNFLNPTLLESKFITLSDFPNPVQNHNINGGVSYDFDDKNSIQWSGMGNYEYGNWLGGSKSQLFLKSDNQANNTYNSTENSDTKNYNISSSLNYKHNFDTSGTKLSIMADVSTYNLKNIQNFSTQTLDRFLQPLGNAAAFRTRIPTVLNQFGIKIDFEKNIFWKLKLETGAKFTSISSDNDIRFLIPKNNGTDSLSSNYFIYKELISAGYINLAKEIGKWKLQAGCRVEYTRTRAENKSLEQLIPRDYTQPFPSASVNYKYSKNTNFTLQYSRRIDRPDYKSLNPFAYLMDIFTSYQGNPLLLPQFTHNFEFINSFFQGALTGTLNYSHTEQFIGDVYVVNPVNLQTKYTFSNIASFENMGVALSLYYPVNKWFTTTNYVYFYQNNIQGNDVNVGKISNSRFAFIINSTQNILLPRKWDLELSFNYESPTAWSMMRYKELWQLSFGVRKKLFEDKLIAKLAVNDVFWTYYWRGTSETNNSQTQINDQYKWDNRLVTFSLTYNFGKKYAAPKSIDQELEEKYKHQEEKLKEETDRKR
ncbi:MAG: hypothetical protein EAZ27_00360 [Cytophagales bacterium]|nr:MAG: hypothetical protein EAZ27_00360 [Cytophagales bacterium]